MLDAPAFAGKRRPAILAAAVILAGCHLSAQASFNSGSSPEKAAEDVFAKVATSGADAAYADTSLAFRQLVAPNAWKAFVVGMNLPGYQGVEWSGRKTTSHGTVVSGMLDARGSIGMPIDVEMTNDGGSSLWKMQAIHFHRLNTITLGEGAQDPGMPAGETLLRGIQLGAACRQLLARQAGLNQVECMQSTPGVAGAKSLCVGITKGRVIGITAHVNSYDAATQDADISCQITDPDQLAGGAAV
jgi:hypothetical protein